MTRDIGRAVLATAAVLGGLAATAEAAGLQPHRALYDLTLATVRGSGDISSLYGGMALEWADACDGWTVNQKVHMDLASREGPGVTNEFNFSSFETKDGDSLRFTMRSITDGEPYEEFVGTATRGADGGEVVFSVPKGETLALPPETMFPSAHLFLLVESALAGKTWLGKVVFSGTGPESLHEVTAFIGPEIPGGSRPIAHAGAGDDAMLALAELRSWPVAMAYFPLRRPDAEPEFEVSYRLMENGVATNLLLDYGDFAMRATLNRLEILAPPDC
jgi:hypothetical protein